MDPLERTGLLVGLGWQLLVFLEISQAPPDRGFGGLEAHAPQNDHNLAEPLGALHEGRTNVHDRLFQFVLLCRTT